MSLATRSDYDCICSVCCKDYRGGAKSKMCTSCHRAKYPPKKGAHAKKKKLVDKG